MQGLFSDKMKKVTGSQPLPIKNYKMNCSISPNFAFVPGYYEWHFIDMKKPKQILLNWVDPGDSLLVYQDGDGNDLEEPQPMTYEQVLDECEDFINVTKSNFDLGEDDYCHNNKKELFDKLPNNAAEIMAKALYNYYIA